MQTSSNLPRPQFGLIFTPAPLPDLVRWARLAEDGGFERIGLADSPSLYRDVYITSAAVLAATRRIHVGPRVTNPVLRHPVATACTLASLADQSDGRVFMGIGTGHSAVLNAGLKPARLDTLKSFTVAVRALLDTGEANWEGNKVKMDWWMGQRPIPIHVAAAGAKSLELAGEVGDGVIIGNGMTPEVLASDLAHIEDGARKSGRSASNLYLQWLMPTCVAEDPNQAGLEARAQMCSNANQVFQHGLEGQFVPAELIEKVRALTQRYRPTEHVKPGQSGHNANLVDELGLRDYLIDRFGIVGSPEQCVTRIRELRSRGVNAFWMSVHTPEKERVIRLLSEKVLPEFL